MTNLIMFTLHMLNKEKASSIQHYQSVLSKKQKEYQQASVKSKVSQSQKCKELEDKIELVNVQIACE